MNWEFKRTAFRNATKPQIPGGGAFWAPEIRHINGKYVLYFHGQNGEMEMLATLQLLLQIVL